MSDIAPKNYQVATEIIKQLQAAQINVLPDPYDQDEQTAKLIASAQKYGHISVAVMPLSPDIVLGEVGKPNVKRWQTNVCVVVFGMPNIKQKHINYRISQACEQVASCLSKWSQTLGLVPADQPQLTNIIEMDASMIKESPNVVARGMVYSMMSNF